MSTKIFLMFFILPFIVSCSKINEPVELENDLLYYEIKQESLRKIYGLKTWGVWQIRKHSYYVANGKEFEYGFTTEDFHQKLKSDNIDIRILRAGILQLPLNPIDNTENLLLNFLNNHDDSIVRLNAAISLAFLGNKAGIDILKRCAEGKFVLSSSGFEQNDAALGLLLLNEKLPEEYFAWRLAEPYYILIN